MENVRKLGEYDFRNVTSINILENDEKNLNSTIIHETIHLLLTKQTKWGLFSYCIKRIQLYDNSYKELMNNLCEYSIIVQEGAAVFAQCMFLLKTSGYDETIEYIKYLKRYNRQYYRYLEPLICYIKLLDTHNVNINLTEDNLITLIQSLAMLALNSDITDVDIDLLKNEHLFQEYLSNEQKKMKYLPNERFIHFIKKCFEIIEKDRSINMKKLIEEILNSGLDEKNKIEEVFFINDKKIEKYEEYLVKLKKYIENMYIQSDNKDQIQVFLESIKPIEIDIKDLPQYSIPTSFRIYDFAESDYVTVLKLSKMRNGIIFFLGNIADDKLFGTDLLFILRDVRKAMKDKFYIRRNAVLFYDYGEKCINLVLVSKKELENLIYEAEIPVIVNYKYCNNDKDGVHAIETKGKEILFYCDRAYPNSINLINKLISKKAKCRIVEYKNMFLLVIKLNSTSNYLLYFLPVAYQQVLMDIRTGKLNVELADNVDGITDTDEYIFTSEEIINKYDIITNCLFST